MARYVKTQTIDDQGRSSTAWRPETTALSSGASELETPVGSVNGTNDEFVFSKPPVMVFRNGVMEIRLGTVNGNTFTFDSPPEEGDEIEGLT